MAALRTLSLIVEDPGGVLVSVDDRELLRHSSQLRDEGAKLLMKLDRTNWRRIEALTPKFRLMKRDKSPTVRKVALEQLKRGS